MLVRRLKPKWMGASYHITRRNCNTFSDALISILLLASSPTVDTRFSTATTTATALTTSPPESDGDNEDDDGGDDLTTALATANVPSPTIPITRVSATSSRGGASEGEGGEDRVEGERATRTTRTTTTAPPRSRAMLCYDEDGLCGSGGDTNGHRTESASAAAAEAAVAAAAAAAVVVNVGAPSVRWVVPRWVNRLSWCANTLLPRRVVLWIENLDRRYVWLCADSQRRKHTRAHAH